MGGSRLKATLELRSYVAGLDLGDREQWTIQLASRRGIFVVSICDVQPALNCPYGSMLLGLVSLFLKAFVLKEMGIATSPFFVTQFFFSFICKVLRIK